MKFSNQWLILYVASTVIAHAIPGNNDGKYVANSSGEELMIACEAAIEREYNDCYKVMKNREAQDNHPEQFCKDFSVCENFYNEGLKSLPECQFDFDAQLSSDISNYSVIFGKDYFLHCGKFQFDTCKSNDECSSNLCLDGYCQSATNYLNTNSMIDQILSIFSLGIIIIIICFWYCFKLIIKYEIKKRLNN